MIIVPLTIYAGHIFYYKWTLKMVLIQIFSIFVCEQKLIEEEQFINIVKRSEKEANKYLYKEITNSISKLI